VKLGEKKVGRPADDEPKRPELDTVSFKIDEEVGMALEELRETVGADIRGWRSVLLRRLVLEAAAKLRDRKK
jgi:hypothetical protein